MIELNNRAIHEAGHTVVAMHLNLDIEYVHIEAVPGTNKLGETKPIETAPGPSSDDSDAHERWAIFTFAGYLAQIKYDPRLGRDGCEDDFKELAINHTRQLARLTDIKNRQVWCRRLAKRARQIVERNWHEILSVADALIRHRRLTGAEVCKIIKASSARTER